MSYDTEKYKIVPITPSREHLISIAVRLDHSFGIQDQQYQESLLRTAAQMYEECIGEGFFRFGLDVQRDKKQNLFYNTFTNKGEK